MSANPDNVATIAASLERLVRGQQEKLNENRLRQAGVTPTGLDVLSLLGALRVQSSVQVSAYGPSGPPTLKVGSPGTPAVEVTADQIVDFVDLFLHVAPAGGAVAVDLLRMAADGSVSSMTDGITVPTFADGLTGPLRITFPGSSLVDPRVFRGDWIWAGPLSIGTTTKGAGLSVAWWWLRPVIAGR